MTAGPIGSYVDQLARELRGPWRVRRGVLREVRDGLDDAAAALMADGAPRTVAERTAVAEFGPTSELAPLFQRELAVLQARRTAAATAIALPVLWLSWDLLWQSTPDLGGASTVVMVLARLTDVVGLGTAALCLAALLVFELYGAQLRTPERLARAVAAVTLAGVFAEIALSAAMTAMNAERTGAMTASHWHALVGLGTLTAIVVVVSSAVRCARACDRASA